MVCLHVLRTVVLGFFLTSLENWWQQTNIIYALPQSFISQHASHAVVCFTKSGILFHLFHRRMSQLVWLSRFRPSILKWWEPNDPRWSTVHSDASPKWIHATSLYEMKLLYNWYTRVSSCDCFYQLCFLPPPLFCSLFTSFPFQLFPSSMRAYPLVMSFNLSKYSIWILSREKKCKLTVFLTFCLWLKIFNATISRFCLQLKGLKVQASISVSIWAHKLAHGLKVRLVAPAGNY